MATITKQRVGVTVNVMEKSVTYMSNSLFQLGFKITKERGLSPDYLVDNRDILERGFFTWLSEQSLLSLHVEIISPDGKKALERWDLKFDYSAEPDMRVQKPPVEEVKEVSRRLRTLPEGVTYRIVVETKPDASDIEGWYETDFFPFSQTNESSLPGWGFGNIFGKLLIREGSW